MASCVVTQVTDHQITIKKDMMDIFKPENFSEFNLYGSEWRLRNNTKDLEIIKKMLEAVQEAPCKIVYADINYRGFILKQICMPNVGSNNIESVESLRRAVMPQLTKLWLNDNYITNISSLEKCHFPKLKVLWLTSNKITQLINQHPQWPQLTQFYIQKNLLLTTRNILKSQYKSLKWAAIQSNHWEQQTDQLYIEPNKQEARIRRRFPSIQRVWMPIYFGQMHNRNGASRPNDTNT